jgi:NADH:ubiquinone oxidoreductase subunit 2 (subunit N)
MTVGSFGVVTVLGREGDTDHDLSRYRGLAGRQPVLALAFAVLLLAQAGAPFTTGLWAKVEVVFAADAAGYVPLGVIALVTAVVAAYFYLRVAVLMYAGGGLGEVEGGITGSADPGAVRVGGGAADDGATPAGAGHPLALESALERVAPESVSVAVTTLNEQILLEDEREERAFEPPEPVKVPALSGLAIWVCVGVTVLFGVWPEPLIDFANQATLLFLPK